MDWIVGGIGCWDWIGWLDLMDGGWNVDGF